MNGFLEVLSKMVGGSDVVAELVAEYDAITAQALYEIALEKLANFEKKRGKKLSQGERERLIATCVYMFTAYTSPINDENDAPKSTDSFDKNEKSNHDTSEAAAALAALLRDCR